MKTYILYILLFGLASCATQREMSESKTDATLTKWMKATVNIQSGNSLIRSKNQDVETENRLREQLRVNKITQAEFDKWKQLVENEKLYRYSGTAIFLKHKEKYFLITARHVIEDPRPEIGPSIQRHPPEYYETIYQTIFLVENATSVLDSSRIQAPVSITSSRRGGSKLFVFSSKENDLGIINIDEQFVAGLFSRGYLPITIEDIDQACILKKQDRIDCLGFTEDLSVIKTLNLTFSESIFRSSLITLPIFSQGVVSESQKDSSFFYANIFVYHGNSGGPIIRDNKLIGLVHGDGSTVHQIKSNQLKYYINRQTKFVKSSLIMPMLNMLIAQLESNP